MHTLTLVERGNVKAKRHMKTPKMVCFCFKLHCVILFKSVSLRRIDQDENRLQLEIICQFSHIWKINRLRTCYGFVFL